MFVAAWQCWPFRFLFLSPSPLSSPPMHAALTTSCSLGCAAGAAAPRPAARRSAGPVGPAPRLGAPLRHAAPRPRSSLAAAAEGKAAPPQAAADTGPGKLISAMEIPAFIPRTDLIQQLYRWGFIEANDAKVRGGKKVEMGEMKKTAAAPAAGRGMRARTSAPLSQLLPCASPPSPPPTASPGASTWTSCGTVRRPRRSQSGST